MRWFALLAAYTRQSFLQWWAHRSFLFTLVVNQAIAPFLGLVVWSVALPDRSDISAYYIALLATQLLTVSYEYHTVTLGIYEGSMNDILLRPHHAFLAPLGESTAVRIWHVLVGVPAIVLVVFVTTTSFAFGDVLMALPALLLAALLRFLFVYMLALSALWIQQAGAVTEYGTTAIFLLGGMAAPIMVFPAGFRPVVEALPFRAMLGFPAEVASGSLSSAQVLSGYGFQLLWVMLMLPMASGVWRRGVRHYTALAMASISVIHSSWNP